MSDASYFCGALSIGLLASLGMCALFVRDDNAVPEIEDVPGSGEVEIAASDEWGDVDFSWSLTTGERRPS